MADLVPEETGWPGLSGLVMFWAGGCFLRFVRAAWTVDTIIRYSVQLSCFLLSRAKLRTYLQDSTMIPLDSFDPIDCCCAKQVEAAVQDPLIADVT